MMTPTHGIVTRSAGNLTLTQALQLNGVDQNLKVPVSNCRALTFWMNTQAMTTNHYLFDTRAGGATGTATAVKTTTLGLDLLTYNEVTASSTNNEAALLNTWVRVYVRFATAQTALMRLSSRFNDTEFVQRRVADLRTYSAPLTAQELSDLKLNSRALASSIQSHWMLEDDLIDNLQGLAATVPGTATFVPY